MSPQEFIERLMKTADFAGRQGFLQDHWHTVEEQEEVVNGLMNELVGLMRKDAQQAIEIADLMLAFAARTDNELHRAVGLRAKAQAIGNGNGHYQDAIPLFEEAIDIHQRYQDAYGEALVCLTYIWALAHVGRMPEAIVRGEWALPVLEKGADKAKVAGLLNSLGLVKNRSGQYASAYELLSQAVDRYRELGGNWLFVIPDLENNRALVLFNKGEFSRAAEIAMQAVQGAENYQLLPSIARAKHTFGMIRFFQGSYNEALKLFDEAIGIHEKLAQAHEIALCKLSKTDCLLELRQFKVVVKLCEELKGTFHDLNFTIEQAEAIRNQASAWIGLRRYPPAIEALDQARQLFMQEKHILRAAYTDLQKAICFRQQKRNAESLQIALASAEIFEQHALGMDASLSRLLASWGYVSEGEWPEASALVRQVEHTNMADRWARVSYQVFHLKGLLAQYLGENQRAISHLSRAVQELESLRGNAMIEHRVNFVEDKQAVYEALVQLWLAEGEIYEALEYVERAKSRTLIELVKARVEANLEILQSPNNPLMARLQTLRSAREEKLRFALKQLENPEAAISVDFDELQREVEGLEDQITELWHQLLIRNQTDQGLVSPGEIHLENIQALLDPDTLLIEFFVVENQFCVFTLAHPTNQISPKVFSLSAKPAQVTQLMQQLNLNFNLVARGRATDDGLLRHAEGYLQRLYEFLIQPIEEELTKFKKLIIVPYASLHTVPFHALYDSQRYLIEKHAISYLPAATLLPYCQKSQPSSHGSLIIGHSAGGKLPYAVEEAQRLAALWGEPAFCENQARIGDLRPSLSDARVLHIACHGDYHDENALFSGLMLDDGFLTTLDVFGLHLHTSLVTLSACQTGRNKMGGGDELLGLMRAFFSAGTISLVMSLWSVSDQSTILWMEYFYSLLKEGKTKGEAIRLTQIEFLSGKDTLNYKHPFFWAPFFLIGDQGKL